MVALDDSTGYLPPGEHHATLEEVEAQFATNYRRRSIAQGLRWVVSQLREKEVETIWIDGSFVTRSMRPNDVDVVYVPPLGSDPDRWGLLSPAQRHELKKMQRVDLWPHPSNQPAKQGVGKVPLIQWFMTDADGVEKGVIRLGEMQHGDDS